MICDLCKKPYATDCDYKQGRCPHHTPMIKGDFPWDVIIVFVLVAFAYIMGLSYGLL
jgi:hypothetical protein